MWMRSACFVVGVWAAGTPSALIAMTGEEALDAFGIAVSSIRSFDVVIRKESTLNATAVQQGTMRLNGREFPNYVWKKLEQPKRIVSFSRQVMSADGRRRFESLSSLDAPPTEVKVFTGEVTRTMSSRTNKGVVSNKTPKNTVYVGPGENYAGLYRELWQGGEYVDLLRKRNNVRVTRNVGEHANLVIVESPPENVERALIYRRNGFRFSLDPDKGMMPRVIEVFSDSMNEPYFRCGITEFLEIEAGVWVPIEAAFEFFVGDIAKQEVVVRVDLERSRWNEELDDELFKLPYSAGARVFDSTRDIAFVAGQGDTGDHVDDLIANAKEVVKVNSGGQNVPSRVPAARSTWIWFVGGDVRRVASTGSSRRYVCHPSCFNGPFSGGRQQRRDQHNRGGPIARCSAPLQ